MAEKYDHQTIEAKWQKKWDEEKVFSAPHLTPAFGHPSPQSRRGAKNYVLDMFPYPSGDGLHVGHPEGYTATDIYSRYLRMKGKNVLHPMGWDAFGLPAENAAIKKKTHPRIVTEQNIKNFKRQIQSIGFSYDWDREINTTDPKYYKWTQWIFLQLFKKGLAYEAESPIWWCPKDKTGLANEEVVGGVCDRCGTPVEKKVLRQWVLKITDYAERLLAGLDKLDWPEGIKTQQRNWIGRSEGAVVKFQITNNKSQINSKRQIPNGEITVFTTRPDTLFGATFLVISPEIGQKWLGIGWKAPAEVKKYIESALTKSEIDRQDEGKEKTGVDTGIKAVNPVNSTEISVWVADYVLGGYGTGAIMAVPAHDERDFEFAKKFKLPMVKVIQPPSVMPQKMAASAGILGALNDDLESGCWVGEGTMINSGEFDGLTSEEGRHNVTAWLESQAYGHKKVNYKLRDWIFSRQRYWGEPIPVVKCASCTLKVESTMHHLELSSAEEWQNWLDQTQIITNAALAKEVSEDVKHKNHYVKVTFNSNVGYWRVRAINKDSLTLKHVLPGVILVPEKELPLLLPDVEKYEPTGTGESPLAAIDEWVNVTCRVCGHPAKRETNTMPQWAGSCWYYLRFTDPDNDEAIASEEAMKAWLPVDLYVGGAEHAVLHLLYSRFWHMVLYDIGAIPKTNDQGESLEEPFRKLKNQGLILGPDGEKMSKSRGNVINPDEIIEMYGADTLRMYEMFMGPFEDAKPWDTNGIVGVRRFLDKVWRAGDQLDSSIAAASHSSSARELPNRIHRYTKSITEGIENFRFNTCVSDFMKWVNEWGTNAVSQEEFGVFLKLLSPFAPHIAEELWANLGHKTLLAQENWPKFDLKKIKEETVTIAVQVMGKLRATMTMPADSDQAAVETAAKAEANVVKYLTEKPKKVIFVKGKLINFVV